MRKSLFPSSQKLRETGGAIFSDKLMAPSMVSNLHSWRNGRRARLRCVWRNPWEFESPRVHFSYLIGFGTAAFKARGA